MHILAFGGGCKSAAGAVQMVRGNVLSKGVWNVMRVERTHSLAGRTLSVSTR
jgi:hypothetical protein